MNMVKHLSALLALTAIPMFKVCSQVVPFDTTLNTTFSTTVGFSAHNSIFTGSNFKIVSGGVVTLRTGKFIRLGTGTTIQQGGTLFTIYEPSLVVGVRTQDAGIPTIFSLRQNYPNPFNPSTIIRYELPKAVNASVKIFNTLGQLVATLVDEHKESGYYQVQWNSSDVPSGIYFYRLQAGKFVETRKMILMK